MSVYRINTPSGVKVKWKCKEGHVWEATWTSVRIRTWCPTCFHQYKTHPHRQLDYTKTYLTDELLEVLDGYLLSDGCIARPEAKRTIIAARLSIGQKEREFAEYIGNQFMCYNLKLRYASSFSKKYQRFYHCWEGTTCNHPDLLRQRIRWYPNGVKIVPKDCSFTPKSVLIWYLGDGCLQKKENTYPRISLSTDGFTKEDINNILLPVLNAIAPDQFIRTKSNTIMSYGDGVIPFFQYIGDESPVACYSYKFMKIHDLRKLKSDCAARKKEGLQKGRLSSMRKYDFDNIIKLRKQGLTYRRISEEVGCASMTAHRVFNRYGKNNA